MSGIVFGPKGDIHRSVLTAYQELHRRAANINDQHLHWLTVVAYQNSRASAAQLCRHGRLTFSPPGVAYHAVSSTGRRWWDRPFSGLLTLVEIGHSAWAPPSRIDRGRTMVARHAIAIVSLLAFSPALAEDLDAEAARQFIVGKLFAFTCADGTRGAARIYDDGSVIGTVQFHGSEQPRPIWLPSETLKFIGETVCGSLNRRELCFALSKTSDQSFRASITGLDFAYCDFTERLRTPDAVPRFAPSTLLSLHRPRGERVQ